MNYTPLPANLINPTSPAERDSLGASKQQTVSMVTKAMVGVLLTLFVILGSFTFLLFQAPKESSRASNLPPTPPFVIPTIFLLPTTEMAPTTTPSGTMNP